LPLQKPKRVELRTGSKKNLIRELAGTPEHTGSGQDIICPHFWILAYGTGCM
jgi:hypothetical protein